MQKTHKEKKPFDFKLQRQTLQSKMAFNTFVDCKKDANDQLLWLQGWIDA